MNEIRIPILKWVGYVEEIREDSFYARLHEITEDTTDEVDVIFFEEVSEHDLKYIKVGATFNMVMEWRIDENGQKYKVHYIEFIKDIEWTEEDLIAIEKRVEKFKNLKWV